mgnify:FL=1
MWRVRPAGAEDLPAIEELVALVDGDGEDLQESQFVVVEDEAGSILGCARLRPYRGFRELASVAVRDGRRARGVGWEMVTTLSGRYQGPLYLVCEDREVGFFRRFGFVLIAPEDAPPGLAPKWRRYTAQIGRINVMRRDAPERRCDGAPAS